MHGYIVFDCLFCLFAGLKDNTGNIRDIAGICLIIRHTSSFKDISTPMTAPIPLRQQSFTAAGPSTASIRNVPSGASTPTSEKPTPTRRQSGNDAARKARREQLRNFYGIKVGSSMAT